MIVQITAALIISNNNNKLVLYYLRAELTATGTITDTAQGKYW
jgi:hypothetical protein